MARIAFAGGRRASAYPVADMKEPGDFFDVVTDKPRSVTVVVCAQWQGVDGRRLATFSIEGGVRVMLVSVAGR